MMKRGISAIVATVLIILITVAAVTIVWSMVIPMITKSVEFNDPSMRFDIVSSEGYTFWDSNSGMLYVQVKRGADMANVVGLEVVISVKGNSIQREYGSEMVPEPNQAKTLIISLGAGSPLPDKITVVPIINNEGSIERGTATSQLVDIPIGSAVSGAVPTPTKNGSVITCTLVSQCNDNLTCTIDSCGNGVCSNVAVDCSNLTSECSVGVCNSLNGSCQRNFANQGGSCGNGSGAGVCNNGVCVPSCGNGVCSLGEACVADCSSEYNVSNFMLCRDGADNDVDGSLDCNDTDCSTKNVCLWRNTNFTGGQVNFIYPGAVMYIYTPTTMYGCSASTGICSNYNFTNGSIDRGNSTYIYSGNKVYSYYGFGIWNDTNYPGASVDKVYSTYVSSGNRVYLYTGLGYWNNTNFPGSTVSSLYGVYVASGSNLYYYNNPVWINTNFTGGNINLHYNNWVYAGGELYYYTYTGSPNNGTWIDTNFTGGAVLGSWGVYAMTSSKVWWYNTTNGVWRDTAFPESSVTSTFYTMSSGLMASSGDKFYYFNTTSFGWLDSQFPFKGLKLLAGYSGGRMLVANSTGSMFFADLP
jgi:hypothetical protein